MSVEKKSPEIPNEEAFRLRLQAIERGLTASVRGRLLEFAKGRVKMLRSIGARCAKDDAAAFLYDAITDTVMGTVTWAPGVPVEVHLHGVIKSRTGWIADRERRSPHVSIGHAGDGDDAGDELASVGGDPSPEAQYGAREALTQTIAWLASDGADAEEMQLLEAYSLGETKPSKVAALTGLTVERVKVVRQRLKRRVDRMPSLAPEDELSQSGTW